ncbi:MAG: endolytic transglycosylase MltG [Marinifilaceae bacterium]|nr:endolytic transglycosylase MltG [Marinifilaceae bacterium]
MSKVWRYSLLVFGVLLVMGACFVWFTYRELYINKVGNKNTVIYITDGDNVNSVYKKLDSAGISISENLYNLFVELKNYTPGAHPGRYRIDNISFNQLINRLRIGDEDALDFTFLATRYLSDIFGRADKAFLYIDSIQLMNFVNDERQIEALGFTKATLPALFIPNTYEMFWTTTQEEFFQRLRREYTSFWNEGRTAKAKAIGLTPLEVSTLASIIDEESSYLPEYRRIAGVYLNRLKRGMKLEADPTLKYANNDFDAKRVLDRHKLIDSPYNTYMYAGLPPGPIRVPSPQAIDAVLNAEKHSFIFFCANSDFSGTHVFAKTLNEHNNNARKYRKALQQRRIYR